MRRDRRRPDLRNHHIYRQIERVLRHFLGRDDLRVVHISIQNPHLHLLVEAANREVLSNAMQSFAIRLQRALGRRGRSVDALLDEFSSAISSTGSTCQFGIPAGYVPLSVSAPRTWLLSVGWRNFGLIDPMETPGPLY